MTTDKIEACYLEQARNLYNRIKPEQQTAKGVPLQNAASLFSTIQLDSQYFEHARQIYLKGIDTNGDGTISIDELATVLQRADKESFKNSTDPISIGTRNDKIADAYEILSDITTHGVIPFMLKEAKSKTTPEQYKKIEKRIKTGAFTITSKTGEEDVNLLKRPTKDTGYVDAITNAYFRYEKLIKNLPQLKQVFWNKLTQGQVPSFNPDNDTVTFKSAEVNDNNKTYTYLEMFNRKDGKSLLTMTSSIGSESLSDKIAITYDPPLVGDVYKDPLAEAAKQKIIKEVLTDENLQYVDEHILNAIDNPQKLAQLIKKIEKLMQKALGLNTTMYVEEKETYFSGGHDKENNRIAIAFKNIEGLKNSYEELGISKDKMKKALVANIFKTISHEYWHAGENLAIKNSQHPMAKEYKENYKHYLINTESIRIFGDTRQYYEQPVEKGSYIVEMGVDNYIKQWYAKRNQATP